MPILRDLEELLQSEVAKSQLTRSLDNDKTGKQLVATAEAIIKNSSLLQRQGSIWNRRYVNRASKDFDKAKSCKKHGAEYFRQKNYLQAAEAYSDALHYAPQNHAEERAFASSMYSNRSLCLLKAQGGGELCTAKEALKLNSFCFPHPLYTKLIPELHTPNCVYSIYDALQVCWMFKLLLTVP